MRTEADLLPREPRLIWTDDVRVDRGRWPAGAPEPLAHKAVALLTSLDAIVGGHSGEGLLHVRREAAELVQQSCEVHTLSLGDVLEERHEVGKIALSEL